MPKRALKIVCPAEESSVYTEVLGQANLPTLQAKREEKIYDLNIWEKIKSRDHPLFKLLPRPVAEISFI